MPSLCILTYGDICQYLQPLQDGQRAVGDVLCHLYVLRQFICASLSSPRKAGSVDSACFVLCLNSGLISIYKQQMKKGISAAVYL